MVRIPIKDFNIVSTAVGTPGVDTSTATVLGTVAGELDQQRKIFQAAEKKKQEIEAESVATNKETQLLVSGLNPLIDKITTDPTLMNNPQKASEYYLTEGQKVIEDYGKDLNPLQQQVFLQKAAGELQQGAGRLSTWASSKSKENSVNAIIEKVGTLHGAARTAANPNDLMVLYNKIPSLANAAVLGDSQKFEQKAKEDMINEYFYGNYYQDPKRMLTELQGPLASLVPAEKLKEYRTVAEARVKTQADEVKTEQTKILLEMTRKESVGLINGTISRVDWSRGTALAAINGADEKVISLRNELERLVFNPEEDTKRQLNNTATKMAQQTKVADLMFKYTDFVSTVGKDTSLKESDIVNKAVDLYTEVGSAYAKGEITQQQYDRVAGTVLKEVNTHVSNIKGGGLFPTVIPAAVHSFRDYAKATSKDTMQQTKQVQELVIPYMAMYQHFEDRMQRPPTKEESDGFVKQLTKRTSEAINPNLKNIPKDGISMRDSRGLWLIFPDHTAQYLGR